VSSGKKGLKARSITAGGLLKIFVETIAGESNVMKFGELAGDALIWKGASPWWVFRPLHASIAHA
jgi:hypothetical protein